MPLIIVAENAISSSEQNTMNNVLNHLDSVATIQKARLNEVIERNFERLDAISSMTQLRLSLASYMIDGNIEDKMLLKKILNDALHSTSNFKSISILNQDRIVLVSTDANMEGQYYASKYPVTDLSGRYISVVKDQTDNPTIRSFAPLILNDSVVGVIVIDAETDTITRITQDYTGLGSTGEIILAKQDTNGDALIITPLRFDSNAVLEKRISSDSANFAITQALLKKEATFVDTIDYRDEPVLSATRYIETTGWGLVVKIDRQETLAPVTNLRYSAGTVLVITVIVVILVAASVARSLSSPIKKLKYIAMEISKGNLDAEIKVMTDDEIGELTTQFDHMRRSVKDRQELKQLAEKLREIDKAKEEFSSMITHELKTPLVPIQGYCELLLDGTLGDLTQKQREKIQIIYDNTLHLARLISDILDVHKLELGQMKFEMCDTSAKDLIQQCINGFKPLVEAKNVKLIDGTTEQDLTLKCDARRILQALNNLVSNAIKFVPGHEGRVEISARRDNGSVLFSVKDNGIGIPKEPQQNLFKKFYQVDTSLGRKAGGTGLGLAISKGIVQAHNGKIWLESEEGKGSIFYFSIPIKGERQ